MPQSDLTPSMRAALDELGLAPVPVQGNQIPPEERNTDLHPAGWGPGSRTALAASRYGLDEDDDLNDDEPVELLRCSCGAIHRIDVDCDCGRHPQLGPGRTEYYDTTRAWWREAYGSPLTAFTTAATLTVKHLQDLSDAVLQGKQLILNMPRQHLRSSIMGGRADLLVVDDIAGDQPTNHQPSGVEMTSHVEATRTDRLSAETMERIRRRLGATEERARNRSERQRRG